MAGLHDAQYELYAALLSRALSLTGLKGKRPFFKMKSCIGELVQRVALPGPCCIHSRLAWPAAAVGRSRNVKMHARRPQKVPVVDKLEWQLPLEIVKYPDPRLRAPNAKIGVFDDKLKDLAKHMFEVMYQDDGVGLAAPQIGVNVRLMVFNETAQPGAQEETVLVNPVILETGRATNIDVEGCLSFPLIYADVERASKIEVQYQDLNGQLQQMQLRDFAARVFQHEYDHLLGVLYHDRMKPSELEKVRPQLAALEEAFIAAHPGVEVQRVPPPGRPAAAKAKGFGSVSKR